MSKSNPDKDSKPKEEPKPREKPIIKNIPKLNFTYKSVINVISISIWLILSLSIGVTGWFAINELEKHNKKKINNTSNLPDKGTEIIYFKGNTYKDNNEFQAYFKIYDARKKMENTKWKETKEHSKNEQIAWNKIKENLKKEQKKQSENNRTKKSDNSTELFEEEYVVVEFATIEDKMFANNSKLELIHIGMSTNGNVILSDRIIPPLFILVFTAFAFGVIGSITRLFKDILSKKPEFSLSTV